MYKFNAKYFQMENNFKETVGIIPKIIRSACHFVSHPWTSDYWQYSNRPFSRFLNGPICSSEGTPIMCFRSIVKALGLNTNVIVLGFTIAMVSNQHIYFLLFLTFLHQLNGVFPKCFHWIPLIHRLKYLLLCAVKRFEPATSCTQRQQDTRDPKVTLIHASVIYQIRWNHWISIQFRENSK